MARNWVVNGECLVKVRGGNHMSGVPIGVVSELGLTSDQVVIRPNFRHLDIRADDFGPDIPAEVLCMLADVTIHMNLIHYDYKVLSICLTESMGLSATNVIQIVAGNQVFNYLDGVLPGAGIPLGNMRPILTSGCHYITMGLTSPVLEYPWRFQTCYLSAPPLDIPLGTEKSIVQLRWRAIPYSPQIVSGNVVSELESYNIPLWDHEDVI